MKYVLAILFSRVGWYSYVVFIFLLVTLPLNSASRLNDIYILQLRSDYLLHSLLLLPWFFFYRIFHVRPLLWLGIGLLFSILIEGVQYVLPYRAFNINDLLANLIGVGIGWIIVSLANLRRKDFHTS